MIEAFANESETANIERHVIAALSAQRQRRENSQVEDIKNITFFTNREDGSRLIPPSPTTHTPEYSGEKTDLQTTNRATQLAYFV